MTSNTSYSYITKALHEMKDAGLIKISETKPSIITATRAGRQLIKKACPDYHAYYLHFSNNGKPGSSERHNEIQVRATGVIACALQSGIKVGAQKPTLKEIASGAAPPVHLDENTFFLNRELKYEEEQVIARAQNTRASGILYSRGLSGMVYNSMDRPLKIYRRAEKESNIRAHVYGYEIYGDRWQQPQEHEGIVFCTDEKAALKIMQARTNAGKQESRYIGDAIWDSSLTGASYRCIPMEKNYITILQYICKFTKDEIIASVFSEGERANAARAGIGEAIIGDLICYEYLSCNITKLAQIKRLLECNEALKIGIVCVEDQEDFIRSFLGREVRFRTIRLAAIEKLASE